MKSESVSENLSSSRQLHLIKWAVCLKQRQYLRNFQCPVWKTKSWWKNKSTCKLKHAHAIPQYCEYFGQMSSKSIFIISSYTVSKLVRFLRHSVVKIMPKGVSSDDDKMNPFVALLWILNGYAVFKAISTTICRQVYVALNFVDATQLSSIRNSEVFLLTRNKKKK